MNCNYTTNPPFLLPFLSKEENFLQIILLNLLVLTSSKISILISYETIINYRLGLVGAYVQLGTYNRNNLVIKREYMLIIVLITANFCNITYSLLINYLFKSSKQVKLFVLFLSECFF